MNNCVFLSTFFLLGLPQLYRSVGSCGGQLLVDTSGYGLLNSPNFPDKYPPDRNCYWNLTVPTGYQVAFKFRTLLMESCCDFVEIIDPNKARYESLLGKYNGRETPSDTLYSSGNTLSITFHSDSSGEYPGFLAVFVKVKAVVFEERPRDFETVTGRSVHFACRINRHQSHRFIRWTHNGNDLNDERYYIQANGDLRISDVRGEDSGKYTCHFLDETYNINASAVLIQNLNSSAVLTIRQQTIIRKDRSTYEASAGDSISIVCAISQKDYALTSLMEWKHNNLTINSADPRISVVYSKDGSCTLTITNVSRSDAGSYSCTARTILDEDTYHTQLIVIGRQNKSFTECYPVDTKACWNYAAKALAPEERSRNVETVTKRTINFTCRAISPPSIQSYQYILWTHNGNQLIGERYSMHANRDLRISNVSVEDSGNYTCHIKNEFNDLQVSASTILTVRQQTTIGKHHSTYETCRLGSISMVCAISEKDEALQTSIHWMRNDMIVNSSNPRISIVDSENGYSTLISELTITNVSRSDAGLYNCIARTSIDEARSDFQLSVTQQPNKLLVKHVECRPRDAKILWFPLYEDGTPVADYSLQYEIRTSYAPKIWKIVALNVSSVDRDYLIPMRFGTRYRFRVSDCTAEDVPNSWCSYTYHECTPVEDVPTKNPENVTARVLRDPASLVIWWTPLPEYDHQAPHLYYEIWYKPTLPNSRWERRVVQDWKQREYVANVSSACEEYMVMVIARNAMGRASGPVPKVIAYSMEREALLLKDLDDTSSMMDVSRERDLEERFVLSSMSPGTKSTRLRHVLSNTSTPSFKELNISHSSSDDNIDYI